MSEHTHFKPPRGFRNPHLQTLLPRLLFRSRPWSGYWRQFELSDGDFVDLCWYQAPEPDSDKPILLIFHGLEGSVESPYVWQTQQLAANSGWQALVMHFRGCGRSGLNRLPRAYHSGDTGDAEQLINTLRLDYPRAPLLLAGFSLGGNMLAQLLTRTIGQSVTAASICCAPLDLGSCSAKIDKGFSRIYRRYLLSPLKQKFKAKLAAGIMAADHPLANVDVDPMTSFLQFDHCVTAPLHGFSGVNDYYQQASGRQFVPQIEVPTLIVHAADDPFMGPAVIPEADELPAAVRYQCYEHGGHMGFITRQQGQWHSWLPQHILNFLKEQLNDNA